VLCAWLASPGMLECSSTEMASREGQVRNGKERRTSRCEAEPSACEDRPFIYIDLRYLARRARPDIKDGPHNAVVLRDQ